MALVAGRRGRRSRDKVLADGVVERRPDDDVYVVDGLRCQPAAARATSGEKLGIEAVEVLRVQRAQRHGPEGRIDVVLDHPLIPVRSSRLQSLTASGHPPLSEVAAECQLLRDDRVLGSCG